MQDTSEATVSPESIGQALAGRVKGEVLTDRFSLTAYATAACIYKIMPLAVVVPKDSSDVVAAVKTACELGVPIIPRGAGSGLCGQALGRGIVLDFTKYMTAILAIDEAARTVRVQPGAVTGDVNEALAGKGLMLGPDPSSEMFCTIGGNLGNNSSGARGIRYGSMKDYVRWLDVVLADGSLARLAPMALGGKPLAELEARGDLLGRIARDTHKLVADHAALIDRYRPHTSKNSAGYNLFEVLGKETLDLTRLVVGSEGTLAVVVEAELAAVPKPKERASILFWFKDLQSAGRAVQPVLSLHPTGCEIMERHFLNIVRNDGSVPKEYLPKDADTVLLVEFLSDDRKENEASIAAARKKIIADLGLAFGAIEAYDPEEQERLWLVRKRAVQILQKLPGPKRITPFVEDVTVPPKNLVAYIEGLYKIWDRYKVEAAIYGHAGDSNLHARPILDLRVPEDVVKMKGIAGEVARLTIDLGGTISCEHGDGLTRSPYLELQFGDLYQVMRQVKRLWDPASRFNPGKVITDEREVHTEDLRTGPDFKPVATGEALDREPWAAELLRCHGCGTCRAYCPVYRVTKDELATPRAKANLLRAHVAGDLDLLDLQDEKMRAVAALCYNCKTCLVECPSRVNIPGLVLKHKEHLGRTGHIPWAEKMMLKVRLVGRLGSLAAPVSNWMLGWRPMRKLMDKVGGVSAGAAMPAFARSAVKEGTRVGEGAAGRKIAYFAGCFEIFNEPGITRDALKVLEALGCDVLIPNQHCCGVPKISAGDARGALDDMRYNLTELVPLIEAGYTVTSGCPSCVLTLADDYPDMAEGDARAGHLASNVRDLHDLVEEMLANSPDAAARFGGSPWKGRRLAYHAPCHLRAAGKGEQPRRLLEKTLGLTFAVSNLKCCGMGGTFGIKSANTATSDAIARETVDHILAAKPEAIVTSCGMCRTQLEKQTGLPVYHPMELLAEAFVTVGRM